MQSKKLQGKPLGCWIILKQMPGNCFLFSLHLFACLLKDAMNVISAGRPLNVDKMCECYREKALFQVYL